MTELKEGGTPPGADASRTKSGVGSGSLESLVNGSIAWLPLKLIWDSDFNRDPGNLDSLKKSIEENGLITPMACTPDGKLLAGRRRFSALVDLGWKKGPFLVIKPEDESHAFRIMLDENVERKPFNDPEMASLIKQFHQMKNESLPAGGITKEDDETKQYHTQEDTALELGISQQTVSDAIKVAELIEENPEWAHLKGKQILNKAKIEKQREELRSFSLEPPDELYDVIVIDPPWPMADGAEYDPDYFRGGLPYPHMSLEDIKKMEIPAADNCVLWLWGINRLLHEAFHVLEAWGFEYKSIITWKKPWIGLGPWLRGQTEHCLLGIKGRVPWECTDQATVFDAPLREHSRKPDEFYTLVDSLCYGRKLDMFSREKREGWQQWGDEVDKF